MFPSTPSPVPPSPGRKSLPGSCADRGETSTPGGQLRREISGGEPFRIYRHSPFRGQPSGLPFDFPTGNDGEPSRRKGLTPLHADATESLCVHTSLMWPILLVDEIVEKHSCVESIQCATLSMSMTHDDGHTSKFCVKRLRGKIASLPHPLIEHRKWSLTSKRSWQSHTMNTNGEKRKAALAEMSGRRSGKTVWVVRALSKAN